MTVCKTVWFEHWITPFNSELEPNISFPDLFITTEASTTLSKTELSVCNQTCFWKFSSLRALNSIMAFILKSSGILPGSPSSSLMRWIIRAWILYQNCRENGYSNITCTYTCDPSNWHSQGSKRALYSHPGQVDILAGQVTLHSYFLNGEGPRPVTGQLHQDKRKLWLAQSKQNLRSACPNGKVEFKFFFMPHSNNIQIVHIPKLLNQYKNWKDKILADERIFAVYRAM